MIFGKYGSYRIALGVLAIAIVFSLASPAIGDDAAGFQKVDPNKIPDELAMMATHIKANYENITTWQGSISFESMLISRGTYAADILRRSEGIKLTEGPNELADISKGVIESNIDFKKNFSFKHTIWSKPREYLDLDKGLTYTSSEMSSERTVIAANEHIIESYPDQRTKDGTILRKIARKQVRKQSQIITDDSDPRICFNIGKPAWVLLSELSDGLRSYNKGGVSNFYTLEKKQTSKSVTYRIELTNPGASQPFEIFVLDSEKGFNPIYVEVNNDKGIKISEITTDFNQVDGIYLPNTRHVIQYDGGDGRLRRDAKYTFNDMKVNMALPENTFSLKNLGLKNGDKFIDKIADKEYKYQDANLVPIAEPNSPPK